MSDTLIPFAPSVAQLHRLALEHWRAGQQLDALGLMRRALSLEEDNVEYRAALARFLTNAGCLAESTYVLAREYPRLLHFGFPLMFLYLSIDTSNEMGLLLALLPRVQSLKWFLTNVPKESLHKTALIVSQTTGASRTLICHSNRLRFMRTLLLHGETARLLRWLEALRMRSGKKYPSIYRSMECVTLCVSGQQEKARAVLQELRRDPRDPSLFPPAETLHVGPQDGLVSQLFTRPENFRLLAEAMCGEIPADCCPADENPWHNLSAFNRSTHDSLALHLMAVTAYNAGAPASLAAEFWNHIARLHPDDPVAEELYHCAIRDALPPRPMPYTWRLSEHSAGQNLALPETNLGAFTRFGERFLLCHRAKRRAFAELAGGVARKNAACILPQRICRLLPRVPQAHARHPHRAIRPGASTRPRARRLSPLAGCGHPPPPWAEHSWACPVARLALLGPDRKGYRRSPPGPRVECFAAPGRISRPHRKKGDTRMKIVDFSQHFLQYAEEWMKKEAQNFATPEDMEAALPGLYLQFLNEQADWLDGQRPGAYFQSFSPEALLEYLCETEEAGIGAPDLLTDRIAELGSACEDGLLRIAADESHCVSLRATAINLLREIASERAAAICVPIVEKEEELREVAVDLLRELGRSQTDVLINRLDSVSTPIKEAFLDVLCNFSGDERIYTYTVHQFLTQPDRRAMYASFLAKLNDPRAIEPLTQALSLSDVDYLDYIEIRNAIEMLGGEVTVEREFPGDPAYEALGALETDK